MADQRESNFFYDHPALIATVVTIGIAAAFLGAIYVNTAGHGHHKAGHGSAHPSASAPAGAAPAGSAKPASH